MLQNNEHEDEDDDLMDISNSLDPVASDISDNDAVVTVVQAVSFSSSSSDAELYDEADSNLFLLFFILNRATSSLFNVLHPVIPFKGCIDPSKPFQCPQSQQCIALQFICDDHPGDCPDSLDENEETCIAAKRLAKENIENFLHAAYTFLFGEKLSKSIDENKIFWFDTLSSAFSVSKSIHSFAEKTFMSSGDLAHFRNIFQLIHDGRLEDIPLFAQEAVNQGLAALVEKLYD
ncbi:unnamed protein product [Adineta steineri]|uniref:Prohormone-4 n=1 Tax=Adineta steineri TaxID=433720 RepID=A0A815K5H5_9BILA|nr:unnamed protein product [Adineta steineri]CAF1391154.1 unnamed protein product [Adineta steineri]CAF1392551.1 unnamed protein product [Adineta steineri]